MNSNANPHLDRTPTQSTNRFSTAAKALLLYTLLVILWGAWVRISHSGDGCGQSWPLCEGEIIPSGAEKKTWIEFSHRLTSGLYGLLVIGFYFWSRKVFFTGHPARKAAFASLVFMIIEALFGAVLVKKGLVGQNESLARVIMMSLHFLNSALLVLTTSWMVMFSSSLNWTRRNTSIFKGVFRGLPGFAGFILLLLGVTGTFAALSTTLFPSISLGESLRKEFSEDGHVLLQIRTLHPVLGVFAGTAVALLIFLSPESLKDRFQNQVAVLRKPAYILATVLLISITSGAITLLANSPVGMKILHLTLAHLCVIFFAYWIQQITFDQPGGTKESRK